MMTSTTVRHPLPATTVSVYEDYADTSICELATTHQRPSTINRQHHLLRTVRL